VLNHGTLFRKIMNDNRRPHIFDVTPFAKIVHKIIDTRTGRANHLRQQFMAEAAKGTGSRAVSS
jgi:hypothetical protein